MNLANIESIAGGTGNDTVVLLSSLAGDAANLGAGNDTIMLDVGKLTASTTIDGGIGTDVLQLNDIGSNILDMTGFHVLNVETLRLVGTNPFQLTVDGGGTSYQTIDGSASSATTGS